MTDVRSYRRLPIVALPQADSRRLLPSHASGSSPTPRYAIWELTLACDQHCIHCGSRAGTKRELELSTEEALDVVAQLRELGVGEVTLVGGEAYLRDDLEEIVRAIRTHGMAASMATGGRTLSAARARSLAEAGLQRAGVSIDGLEPEHDRLRGVSGSWRSAFEAIGHLRAAGIATGANTQLNRWTFRSLAPLLELLAEAGIRGWQLQLTAAFGNAADHPAILLEPYMLLEVYERLDTIIDRARELGIIVFPANNLGYFGPLEAKLRADQGGPGHYRGCVAGRHQIGIESHGAIKGCPSLGGVDNVGGSIREHSLRDLWERSRELRYMRERSTAELWGYCAECYYADTCRAGCTGTGEPLLGRPGNNPFCHHRALEMDRLGLRERIEQVAAAPGVPFDHGLYRVIRERKQAEPDERHEVVAIEGPRTSRSSEWMGPGRELSDAELGRRERSPNQADDA